MVFGVLSSATGIGENALKLLVTVLLGYPTAYYYKNNYIAPKQGISKVQQVESRNYYITTCGILMAILFNGVDVKHSIITVVTTYLICEVFGNRLKNRLLALTLVWFFNAIYLLSGYYAHLGIEDYDLTWTMPQCVLCLRMMGFGFDFYDGQQLIKEESKKVEVKETKGQDDKKLDEKAVPKVNSLKKKQPVSFTGVTALKELPPFFHFLGYSYFFSAFLVGPQFSFALYNRFIRNEHAELDKNGKLPSGSENAALKCALKGIIYLVLQQVLDIYFPPSYLLGKEYMGLNFLKRVLVLWITGRGFINKYLGIWTLNEGACILSGISFNGYDQNNEPEWDGLTNIDTYAFETATSLDGIIACFNINTNFWIKQYVFKRLRFLNNKYLSQFGSLVFLSIWHGFHSGYMVTFLLEFLDTFVEKKLTILLTPTLSVLKSKKSPLINILNIVCYLYTSFALLYAIIGFGFLRPSLYLHAYYQVYFIGHVGVMLAFVASIMLPKYLRTKSKDEEKIKKSQ